MCICENEGLLSQVKVSKECICSEALYEIIVAFLVLFIPQKVRIFFGQLSQDSCFLLKVWYEVCIGMHYTKKTS